MGDRILSYVYYCRRQWAEEREGEGEGGKRKEEGGERGRLQMRR